MFCRPISVAKVEDYRIDGPNGEIPVRLYDPRDDTSSVVRLTGLCKLKPSAGLI